MVSYVKLRTYFGVSLCFLWAATSLFLSAVHRAVTSSNGHILLQYNIQPSLFARPARDIAEQQCAARSDPEMSRGVSRVEARHLPAILLPVQRRAARDSRTDSQPARRPASPPQVLRRHRQVGVWRPSCTGRRYVTDCAIRVTNNTFYLKSLKSGTIAPFTGVRNIYIKHEISHETVIYKQNNK